MFNGGRVHSGEIFYWSGFQDPQQFLAVRFSNKFVHHRRQRQHRPTVFLMLQLLYNTTQIQLRFSIGPYSARVRETKILLRAYF